MNSKTNYIVPFYGMLENGETEFIGSAFILKPHYLITAGHNIYVEGKKQFCSFLFEFENKMIPLNDPIHSEYINSDVQCETYYDLVIYDISTGFDHKAIANALILTNKTLEPGLEFSLFGYDQLNTKHDSAPFFKVAKILDIDFCYKPTIYNGRYCTPRYYNVFSVNSYIKPGNSGSPIFINNEVYGMVVYGFQEEQKDEIKDFQRGSKAIKSSYIQQVFERIQNIKH